MNTIKSLDRKYKFVLVFLFIVLFIPVGFVITKHKVGDNQDNSSSNFLSSNNMKLTSPVFQQDSSIPSKYTCDGEGVNPPLEISEIPAEAKSLALIVEDPDAPVGLWVHWMIWNIPANTNMIAENSTPSGIVGKNSSSNRSFDDICPPNGEHRYYFKIFALDTELDLGSENVSREDFYNAIEGHILDSAELMGKYKRI